MIRKRFGLLIIFIVLGVSTAKPLSAGISISFAMLIVSIFLGISIVSILLEVSIVSKLSGLSIVSKLPGILKSISS